MEEMDMVSTVTLTVHSIIHNFQAMKVPMEDTIKETARFMTQAGPHISSTHNKNNIVLSLSI